MSKKAYAKKAGKKYIFLLALFFFSVFQMQAQDPHYTQFYNAPFKISPGLTGLFDGNIRVMGNYRNQWPTVPVDYRTLTLAADAKLYSKKADHFFSTGLAVDYDQAGYSKLSHTSISLLGSYSKRLSRKTYLSLGGMVGMHQRAFKLGSLTFDNQYNGNGGLDPGSSNGENLPNLNNNFMDLAAGLNFRFQTKDTIKMVDRLDKRTKFDIGVGIYHVNTPNQSFLENTNSPLSVRVSPYILGTLQLTPDIDIVGNFFIQYQTTYREYLYSVAGKLHLNRQPGKQIAIQLGVSHRFHDFGESYGPVVELFYNGWRAGISWDVNVSEFSRATNGYSGPEFSVQYQFRKVPLPKFKVCPII